MMLPEYLADVAREMRSRSASIRRDFAEHRLSAGENREDLVQGFLRTHLPKKFGVNSGMVISHDGAFSNQADLVVVDERNNAPLYGATRNQLWPAEAVYSLVEVKTSLGPAELADAVAKGRRFKTMSRRFCQAGEQQRIQESLFVIWAFDAGSAETFKANLHHALSPVPTGEQPDLVVVPDKYVVRAGQYLELSAWGQPGSEYRKQLQAQHGTNLNTLMQSPFELYEMGENALMAWYLWFDSWLRQAGSRLTDPVAYLPPDQIFGRVV
jgi:hypothetical protein